MTLLPDEISSTPATRRVVVIVGTDHHPFDRLINWVNDWLSTHTDQTERFFVQWGATSGRPRCPGGHFLEFDELATLLDQADIIICHGGPGTISEAWARGVIPIVVPRLAKLGEHVDDHQSDFCAEIAARGRIELAYTFPEFSSLLAKAESDLSHFRILSSGSGADQAVAHLGGLIEELVSRPRRLFRIGEGRWLRYCRRIRRSPHITTGS
jgi:UDP-N-acetylglucosamine transferase subunit ALG13